jgi:hypothetical protein
MSEVSGCLVESGVDANLKGNFYMYTGDSNNPWMKDHYKKSTRSWPYY